jgi:hypothetical protein
MRNYIPLMFEVTAVVCLIAAVVVLTDIFWSKSLPPSAQPTGLSEPQKHKKSPATAEDVTAYLARKAPTTGRIN